MMFQYTVRLYKNLMLSKEIMEAKTFYRDDLKLPCFPYPGLGFELPAPRWEDEIEHVIWNQERGRFDCWTDPVEKSEDTTEQEAVAQMVAAGWTLEQESVADGEMGDLDDGLQSDFGT